MSFLDGIWNKLKHTKSGLFISWQKSSIDPFLLKHYDNFELARRVEGSKCGYCGTTDFEMVFPLAIEEEEYCQGFYRCMKCKRVALNRRF